MARKHLVNLALVGPALHDVREVMVEGPSGIKALAEPGDRPRWEAGRRRLLWKNGSAAYAFSAEDPDSLRGPQFHAAWADEFCAWREPETVLSNLRFGLRLGTDPKLAVTTTPRPIPALRRLMAEAGTVTDRAGTAANAANLAPGFLAHLTALYGGTRLEAQELEGLVVEGEGALFRIEDLKRARGARPAELDRVVVAVDPPASAHGDACGIVVVGRKERRAFVLADRTVRGMSPRGWAGAVAEAVRDFGAREIVAEGNQGGEMVRSVLAQADCAAPVKLVHASRSKAARAEPVALLYEQGRVIHCGEGGGEAAGWGRLVIEGYASLWGAADLNGDVVQAGAFAESLAKTGAEGVRMLHGHDGRAVVGVWDEIAEDARGLFVRGRIMDWSPEARLAQALSRAGALDGLSIGYRTARARRQGRLRVLSGVELWEVSLVTFPMLPGARFSVSKTPA